MRVTRIAKDAQGNVTGRTVVNQQKMPTYEEYLDAELQLKKWAWVQTEIIMREMATATPEELAAQEWDDAEGPEELMRLYRQQKELGD